MVEVCVTPEFRLIDTNKCFSKRAFFYMLLWKIWYFVSMQECKTTSSHAWSHLQMLESRLSSFLMYLLKERRIDWFRYTHILYTIIILLLQKLFSYCLDCQYYFKTNMIRLEKNHPVVSYFGKAVLQEIKTIPKL